MKPRRLTAITFPVAPPVGTTIRTSDGVDWQTFPFFRPAVWVGSVDGEHSVGCRELAPSSRITAEDLIPDQPLNAVFWAKVHQWRAKVDAKRAAKKKPRA
jgi:hypothetical protein